ncbi:MAG: amino acid permease [Saprospiraceae bacterium]|nr:amino acid permease [Saprospiraceae bacterium]
MKDDLQKKLNVTGLTMIGIGATIGSGIFVTPADTIARLPHYGWAFVPWILGGIAAYCGAMTFAELGAAKPKAGGVYVYLKDAFGPLSGFLYGWTVLLVINSGALAALGIAFADYMGFFIKLGPMATKILAITAILLLSGLNVLGIQYSDSMSRIFTGLKLLAMVAIIGAGAYAFIQNPHVFNSGFQNSIPSNLPESITTAFIGVFWSIGGWHHISYVSSEAINPARDIPRALIYSIGIITLVYLAIIAAYMAILPSDQIASSSRIAGDAIAHLFKGGGQLVAVFIAISIFGTIAIYTMSAPRIYFAMARDKVFFSAIASIHPKFKTPANAIMIQAVWASLLVLLYGSFMKVIAFVTFMDILFMALAASSIFIIRRRHENTGTFRIKQYPLLPLIYLLITLIFVVYTLMSLNQGAFIGLGILVAGILAYYLFKLQSHPLADNT